VVEADVATIALMIDWRSIKPESLAQIGIFCAQLFR
jgi:hypothetical protein